MLLYRIGRALQLLALIDCGVALFLGLNLSKGGMALQLKILLFAVVLFALGRFLQKRGEKALRAGEGAAGDLPAPSGEAGGMGDNG